MFLQAQVKHYDLRKFSMSSFVYSTSGECCRTFIFRKENHTLGNCLRTMLLQNPQVLWDSGGGEGKVLIMDFLFPFSRGDDSFDTACSISTALLWTLSSCDLVSPRTRNIIKEVKSSSFADFL